MSISDHSRQWETGFDKRGNFRSKSHIDFRICNIRKGGGSKHLPDRIEKIVSYIKVLLLPNAQSTFYPFCSFRGAALLSS